jgi:HD domain
MTATTELSRLVLDARGLARTLLADLPERWRHTVGVGRRAEQLTGAVPEQADGEILIAAAWLHDIGYAEALHDTGFHPLDGGLHLRAAGWPERVAGLVAHHSEALCVAHVRGLADRLATFTREHSPAADALTYADQTVGPNGRSMTVEERLADMLRRHGPDSPNALAHPQRAPRLRATVRRVEQRLADGTGGGALRFAAALPGSHASRDVGGDHDRSRRRDRADEQRAGR